MKAPGFRPAVADRSRLVPLDFGRLYLRDLGPDAPADGPPLMLIHGLLVYGYAFRALIPELADVRRLLIPDLPGAGDSDRPPPVHCAGYSPTWLARVLVALLDRLGVDQIDLLGHSWGGAVAVCLADVAPQRVRRLILVDATCFAMPFPIEGRVALVPGIGPYVFKNLYRRSALAHYLSRALADPSLFGDDDLDLYWDRLARTGGREAAYAMLTQLANDERMAAMLPRLRALACPTRVVWGERDAIVPPDHAERLARAIPGASLTWVERCGHAVAEERPAALAALVREHVGVTAREA